VKDASRCPTCGRNLFESMRDMLAMDIFVQRVASTRSPQEAATVAIGHADIFIAAMLQRYRDEKIR
jgi:hypothetical protein